MKEAPMKRIAKPTETQLENRTWNDEEDSNDLQDAIATQSQTETLIKEATILCKGRANGLR